MTLDDDDIEAIAERVASKLQPTRAGLVDAKQFARMLGVDRTWCTRTPMGWVRLD
jgi:hypothetical protein